MHMHLTKFDIVYPLDVISNMHAWELAINFWQFKKYLFYLIEIMLNYSIIIINFRDFISTIKRPPCIY